jgi:CRISPR-associated endoribonuclease Cas6
VETDRQLYSDRIPVLGLLGTLSLHGDLERFVPYLQICEAMNAGSHAALGFGRYRLSLLP